MMNYEAHTPEEYISLIPEERQTAFRQLREVIQTHLPEGFQEMMNYGMIGYVVPHSLYPAGYHCNPQLPLPFMGIASQKNFIAFYHMGIYSDQELLKWFTSEYPKYVANKLDMGKSCVRFKNINQIPYQLIGELVEKITANEWIQKYDHFRNKTE